MGELVRRFRAWSGCDECGFEGLMDFECRSDEDYSDISSLGVMVDASCPACESLGSVLVAFEHFQEMQADARRRNSETGQD